MIKININKAYSRNGYKKLLIAAIAIFSISAITIYSIWDFFGPSEINLKADNVFGFSCLRANDLVVQEYDKNGNLWASRGMIIYKLTSGERKFKRIAHVPTGLSIFWLRNFSILRKLTVRPECIEMIVTNKGDICALSAGRIWILSVGEEKFKETFKLDHYGFGDQGIRNDGILTINDSTVFIGEYFQNPDSLNVRIFKSSNKKTSWKTVYEFKPKSIRHIHAIQEDPYTKKLWVLTGDLGKDNMIAWSDNEFKSIEIIGKVSQVFRVCQLIFTEDALYWGSDTSGAEEAGIYRWDKNTEELQKIQKLYGSVFFGTRLSNGTIAMGINCNGDEIEQDDKTRLVIITKNDKINIFPCGSRNRYFLNFWDKKFAQLRFQRNQGSSSLAITCLNQKEVPDGELIIISEDTLQKAVNTKN